MISGPCTPLLLQQIQLLAPCRGGQTQGRTRTRGQRATASWSIVHIPAGRVRPSSRSGNHLPALPSIHSQAATSLNAVTAGTQLVV
jgi:hypothetical protein